MRKKHKGVSLLEVLIAIFVLAIGLLGVAAMIPVGRYAIVEAAKSDRAAACGQAGLSDVKVRGIINPGSWWDWDESTVSERKPPAFGELDPPETVARSGFLLGESYAIDSLNLASQTSDNARRRLQSFPYNIRKLDGFAGDIQLLPGRAWRWTRMRRVTWSGVGMNRLLASEVFGWHDDLVIPPPADRTRRPRQMFMNRSASGVGVEGRAFPFMAGDGGAVQNPLQSQDAGNYSWLVTATPTAEVVDFVSRNDLLSSPEQRYPYHYSENAPHHMISIIVFYKRDTPAPGDYSPGGMLDDETPSERQVELMFLGTGLGGGDVLLFTLHQDPADVTTDSDRRDYLDVKENEWLMVSGFYTHRYSYELRDGTQVPRNPSDPDYEDPPVSTWVTVGVHKWYRIVTAGETVSEDLDEDEVLDPGEDWNSNGAIDWYREVTLAGPDWNPEWAVDLYGDGRKDKAIATVLNGVIGVYSTMVELEW